VTGRLLVLHFAARKLKGVAQAQGRDPGSRSPELIEELTGGSTRRGAWQSQVAAQPVVGGCLCKKLIENLRPVNNIFLLGLYSYWYSHQAWLVSDSNGRIISFFLSLSERGMTG